MAYLIETQRKPKEIEEEIYSYAMHLATGMALPMAMQATIELGVFEIIAKAGETAKLSASEIALQIPNNRNPDATKMLDRILRLLVSYSVLSCSSVSDTGERLYSLAPVAKYFVTNEDGVSLCPRIALSLDEVYMKSWFKLKDAIVEGGTPFNKVHGMQFYEYLGGDPRLNEAFNRSMFNTSSIAIKKILEPYKGFEHINHLVDVGGGFGSTLSIITSKYPHIKAVNFDLPHVIQNAPSYPGVEHIGGDMFESIPKSDAILMKWILHNWDDNHCIRILKNCYKAIPDDGGKVIVIDGMVPIEPKEISSLAARDVSLMDVIMLTLLENGKERTEKEFQSLATAAGFRNIKYQCCSCNLNVIEFLK